MIVIVALLQSCSSTRRSNTPNYTTVPEPVKPEIKSKISTKEVPSRYINTKKVNPGEVVDFAKTLIGIKYKYGSVIKEQGFDCSGFINYVFNHFNIQVPRTTIDFTNAGTPVPLDDSREGDLILFTGTDTTGWIVGHMGIIIDNENGNIDFIHSSSGKAIGVIISSLSKYYATRFVKVIRVFP
ncbi:MAG: C40 family peptidase [Bacteroidota bacterium]|nr:C40 family peptidase [Bacteroidota bacterium]